jgi:UDP-N-acetylmuramyl pentapeptide phosphotransferase/UDP-N-acetylglucosamine-1-phosphate transferase
MIKLYILSLLSSFGLYFLFLFINKKLKFIDQSARSSNGKKGIPTQFGFFYIILFCLFLFLASIYELLDFDKNIIPRPEIFLFALIILSILSIIDFKYKVHPFVRLIIQFNTVFISLSTLNIPYLSSYIPYKLEVLIILYFWIYFINCSNFIDGIDTSLNLFIVTIFLNTILCIYLLNLEKFFFISRILFLFIVLTCSFIFFNLPKAKIFAGDSGSIPSGYIIGWLNIFIILETEKVFIFIISSYLITDVTITLFKKVLNKRIPWARDFDYFFLIPTQYAKKKHTFTLQILTFNQIILFILSVLRIYYNQYFFLFLAMLSNIITICYFQKLKNS